MNAVEEHRRDLAGTTYEWSMQWWDHAEHMVWNPPGFDAGIAARQLHLVPNTAWLAYAQLAHDNAPVRAEGMAAIHALIALQYDEPTKVFHGTYRRFLEQPPPPEHPVMWEHYDPNWRQFVGTTFALIIEDFEARLPRDVVASIEQSIELACRGEPDRRIPTSYSNPALMRAWLDAWFGRRRGDNQLFERGRAFARAIVAEFDAYGAFEEFNSPTYYGIDLYALRLWRVFPPDDFFAEAGSRLETALWRSAGTFYNANLENFCGPFTRAYHPDATRSVVLFSLWTWALLGRERAPLPQLDDARVDHGHDLMAGPVFARLAGEPDGYDLADFRGFTGERKVAQRLARGREVSASLGRDLMIGAESSDIDWGGWSQFMPVTAHWRTQSGAATMWMIDAHRTHATVSESTLHIGVPVDTTELRFRVASSAPPVVRRNRLTVAGIEAVFDGDFDELTATPAGGDLSTVTAHGRRPAAGEREARVSFHRHIADYPMG